MFELVSLLTEWSVIMSTIALTFVTYHDCTKNDQENIKALIRIIGRKKNGE